tara:strand:- start:64 stop:252 length:189 start_codon:yes stop_codon:yes gene_type:complete
MKKKAKILDNDHNEIEVDVLSFFNHIMKYHSKGESIHEERGYYFTVNDKFRKKIKQLLDLEQ